MEKIERKLAKNEILWYSGVALFIIMAAFILNFVLIFPLSWQNSWIYGIIIFITGFGAYFISLFFLESFHFFLEIFSVIIIAVGEFLIVAYFFAFETIWISIYFIIPSITFLGLAALTYDLHSPELKDRRNITWGIIIVSGSLILLIIEALIRSPNMLQIPILGIILISGGVLFYLLVIWKIIGKPSYVITLIGASIISIGIILIEIFYQLYQPLIMTMFIAPGLVFFILILINYRLLKTKAMIKSEFSHQSGLTPKFESESEEL